MIVNVWSLLMVLPQHWHTVKHVYLSLYIFKFIHVGMHRFGKPALINYHVLMCINNGVLALTVAP